VLRSGGLSHETQSDLGLCSVVVLVVVHSEAQRAFVIKPQVEKKVASCRSSLLALSGPASGLSLRTDSSLAHSLSRIANLQPRPWWRTHEFLTHRCCLRSSALAHNGIKMKLSEIERIAKAAMNACLAVINHPKDSFVRERFVQFAGGSRGSGVLRD
jgi:hypothetical protein